MIGKILLGLLALLCLGVFIAGVAFVGVLAMIASDSPDERCCDCDYFESRLCKGGYCYHWEEHRKPDEGICEAFKNAF